MNKNYVHRFINVGCFMKIFVFNKRSLAITLALFLLVGCLVSYNLTEITAVFSPAKKDLPIYCVDKDEKIIALSFDAAWGNEDTNELIEIFKKYDIKTTFFVVGSWVDKYPESVKALYDAGHEIMNHSNTHPYMTKLSKEKMIEEVNKCDEKIEAITGVKPTLFRPPYGDYNDEVVATLREIGHYTIQWDVDSLDWKDYGADAIVSKVTKKVKNGSIVLFHNAAKHTPKALPVILETLIKDGYKIVPVSNLILKDNFYIDTQGKQILNTTNN